MDEAGSARETYSKERLADLAHGLSDMAELLAQAKLCVYATGSYGRLEAWEESDIDLFFLYEDTICFSYLTFLRVAGRLVEKTAEMEFPPFSGNGKYLESLDVTQMEQILGSREDDQANTFTARMLLLLESQPVSDAAHYDKLLRRIVGFYYRDIKGHEADFVPIFLMNDILRFWRTLTLNYEHDRFAVRALEDEGERNRARAKSSLKNYKLKVSRLATCFSMVVHLASADPPVTAERVIELCRQTPQRRLELLRGRDVSADGILDELAARYEIFLEQVQRPEETLLEVFGDAAQRRAHLDEAARYGDGIFKLLILLVPPDRLRHVVI